MHDSGPGDIAGPAGHASTDLQPATLEAEQDLVVDGHHFKAQCAGQGPSVMLVIGYGGTMEDWGDLPTRLGATARTCMYDRLGIGRSDSRRRSRPSRTSRPTSTASSRPCGCPAPSWSSGTLSAARSP